MHYIYWCEGLADKTAPIFNLAQHARTESEPKGNKIMIILINENGFSSNSKSRKQIKSAQLDARKVTLQHVESEQPKAGYVFALEKEGWVERKPTAWEAAASENLVRKHIRKRLLKVCHGESSPDIKKVIAELVPFVPMPQG